jgi:hypothetical protein
MIRQDQENTDSIKLLHRFQIFLAVYFAFLILDFTSSDELYPHFVYQAMGFYSEFWNWLVPWTGEHILHLPYPITVKPAGSGDTTYNYVLQLLWVVFSLLIAIIGAATVRKQSFYKNFSFWSRIIIRYYLGYMLLVYGFYKVIKLQFPFPDLVKLADPFGNSSPMGLAWSFVGYSTGYNLFIGGAEVLAGALLFFRRTTLLGALLAITVLGNVAAMNFAYDIPVKIFSLNLLVASVWVAWYDKDRLIGLFITHTAIPAKPRQPVFQTKWKKITRLCLKTVAIGFSVYATLWHCIKLADQYGDTAAKPPLYGIYDVEIFKKNDKEVPPLATDESRWKKLIISYPGYARITQMTDSTVWATLKVDTVDRTVDFTFGEDLSSMQYALPDSTHLVLSGMIDGDSLNITLKKYDLKRFPLISRGFHWINEYPYNR